MSKKQFIKRHHLIINKLRSNPCSFKDLQNHLEKHSIADEENYIISKRTFERDLNEIREIYKIDIEYNRSQNQYEIIEDADQAKTDRIMESFQIFNALRLTDSVSNHLILEKRKPLGTEHMYGLLHAIKNNFEVKFTHGKFWETEKKQRTVHPLALKEAKHRWYLVAFDTKDGIIKTFGLERITNLEIPNRKFTNNGYDLDNKFRNSFGVITNEIAAQKILLSFSDEQAKYVKSLPLHHSQKIVNESSKECIIELFLAPTYDFVMELMSMGAEVTVLEPLSLREEIVNKFKSSLNNYK